MLERIGVFLFDAIDMAAIISVVLLELGALVIIFGYPEVARSFFQNSWLFLLVPIILPIGLVMIIHDRSELAQ